MSHDSAQSSAAQLTPKTSLKSTSRLDPLPSAHPLSLRIRSLVDASSSSLLINNDKATIEALQEIERRYGSRHRKRGDASTARVNGFAIASSSTTRHRVSIIDTEKARRDIEKDAHDALEAASLDFLAILGQFDDAVQDVGSILGDMRVTCTDIDKSMRDADTSTQYLLQHARGIRKQRYNAAQNADILDAFLKKFTLTQEEHEEVVSRTQPVGSRLFATLDKLKRIRQESQVLLVGQEEGTKGGMKAGIDVVEETSGLIDVAQQKVAKWLQMEMRAFAREGFDSGDRIREAIARLDNREELLRPALTTLATSRANSLSSAFHRALTIGGPAPSHLPRPIEVHAHDPLRYVGDMLAWVHQAIASERDTLSGIFAEKDATDGRALEGRRRPGERRRGLEGSIDWSSRDFAELSRAEQWIRLVLDKVIEGCSSPLKNRIEHTVRSQEGCITTFRLTTLIQFYRVTIERTLGTKASMSILLRDLSILSHRAFVSTLDSLTAGLSRFNGLPEDDLGAPPPVLGASGTLKELLSAHQVSLAEADLFGDALPLKDLSSNEPRDFATLVQRIIQPILDLCNRIGDAHVERRPRGKSESEATWERNIFTSNCLSHVRNVMEPFPFTARASSQLESAIEQHLDALTTAHHDRLLDESGLRSIRTASQDSANATEISAAEYSAAFADFERFLASPTLLSSPHLGLLSSPAMRALVHARALEFIAQDYETIIAGLLQKQVNGEGASELPSMPQRDAEQVRLLLGIERRITNSD